MEGKRQASWGGTQPRRAERPPGPGRGCVLEERPGCLAAALRQVTSPPECRQAQTLVGRPRLSLVPHRAALLCTIAPLLTLSREISNWNEVPRDSSGSSSTRDVAPHGFCSLGPELARGSALPPPPQDIHRSPGPPTWGRKRWPTARMAVVKTGVWEGGHKLPGSFLELAPRVPSGPSRSAWRPLA